MFGGKAFGADDAALKPAFATQSDGMRILTRFSRLGMQFAANGRFDGAEGAFHGVLLFP
jgi:hypothetical protein